MCDGEQHAHRVVFEWYRHREFVHQFLDSSSHQNSPCDLWAQSGRWCGCGLEGHGPGRLSVQPGIEQSDCRNGPGSPSLRIHTSCITIGVYFPKPLDPGCLGCSGSGRCLGATEVAGASSDLRPQEVSPASVLFRKPASAMQHVPASLLEDESQASPGAEPSQPSCARRGPRVWESTAKVSRALWLTLS